MERDKKKNIVSNTIGVILIFITVYSFIKSYIDLKGLIVLLLFSLSLFVFKISQTRNFLGNFLKKVTSIFTKDGSI